METMDTATSPEIPDIEKEGNEVSLSAAFEAKTEAGEGVAKAPPGYRSGDWLSATVDCQSWGVVGIEEPPSAVLQRWTAERFARTKGMTDEEANIDAAGSPEVTASMLAAYVTSWDGAPKEIKFAKHDPTSWLKCLEVIPTRVATRIALCINHFAARPDIEGN